MCIFILDARRYPASSVALSAGLLVASALFFWIAHRLHILDTMLGFGAGAYDLPIIPAPHILVYFAALFLCACYLYRRVADGTSNENTFSVIVYAIPTIAAALGGAMPHMSFSATTTQYRMHRSSSIGYTLWIQKAPDQTDQKQPAAGN